MKVLFVASRPPWPPMKGDQARAYHQLRILARHNEVHLVSPAPHRCDRRGFEEAVASCASVTTVGGSAVSNLVGRGFSPWRAGSMHALLFLPARIARVAEERLDICGADVAHVQLARSVEVVRRIAGKVPVVVDLIDALSMNLSRRALSEPLLTRIAIRLESKAYAWSERLVIEKADIAAVSSPVDRDWLGGGDSLRIVPNGVDVDAFPLSQQARRPDTIVLTGTMSYAPNVDAAVWFARDIFPLIRRERADAELLIVGSRPDSSVRALSKLEGVQVTGLVPSVGEYIGMAKVAVAPMRMGSGTQFKVLEAMACGTPVVATTLSSDGLGATAGQHLLTKDDPEGFAAAVISILTDDLLWRGLSQRGREFVESRFTWEHAVALLTESYRAAIRERRESQCVGDSGIDG